MNVKVDIKSHMNPTEISKWKLLVVEDDKALNTLIQKRLHRAGFNISGAFNGEEAFEFISENPDSLILLDYQLPDIDGREFVIEMRKRGLDAPFIVLTGHGGEEIAVEMMKLGARDYLIKEANILDYLPEIVVRVLKETLIERELARAEETLRENEKRLEEQNVRLDRKNIALKEILGQLEVEKETLNNRLVANIDHLLLPLLERLKSIGQPEDEVYIDLIEKTIEDITSSFGENLLRKANNLTSREVEICNMIKNGLTTKGIAQALIISKRTVEFHRDNIRGKLNIKSKGVSLLSYLTSL
jgi:FixJ family two-component response regulator